MEQADINLGDRVKLTVGVLCFRGNEHVILPSGTAVRVVKLGAIGTIDIETPDMIVFRAGLHSSCVDPIYPLEQLAHAI